MIYKIGNVLIPILIYYLVANICVLAFGGVMDNATLTSLVGIVVLMVLAILYRRDQKTKQVKAITLKWWMLVLAATLGVVSNWFISSAMSLAGITESFSNTAQEALLAGDYLVQIIGLGVIVPIMEEVLFRGLVYQRLKKYMSWQSALLIGATLFALYHGNVIQMVFAFLMGLIIGLLYQKWNHLAVPVAFHMVSNLATILLGML